MADKKYVTEINATTGETTTREYTSEEYAQAETDAAAYDADITQIRLERNAKLTNCDWTQGSDSPLSNSKKAEWVTYRQELRDFMEGKTKKSEFTKDSDGAMVWPTEPS